MVELQCNGSPIVHPRHSIDIEADRLEELVRLLPTLKALPRIGLKVDPHRITTASVFLSLTTQNQINPPQATVIESRSFPQSTSFVSITEIFEGLFLVSAYLKVSEGNKKGVWARCLCVEQDVPAGLALVAKQIKAKSPKKWANSLNLSESSLDASQERVLLAALSI